MYLQYIEFLKGVIEEAMAGGELEKQDPWDVSFSLSGIINAFIFQWVNIPSPYSLLDKHEIVMEFFLSGAKKKPTKRRLQ